MLRDGGLVAFPTETVYGLGADALHEAAVRRVFLAKGRPADNPLIVHLASAADLGAVASSVPPLAARLAGAFWPGALTLVLDAGPRVPAVVRGGLATVAARVPDHPVALALLDAAQTPVAAPSANSSGRPSPTTAGHVVDDLDGAVDIVLDGGPCALGVESTVVDARGSAPLVLRDGAVTREALEAVAGGATSWADHAAAPPSPGVRYRHYRPRCRVVIAPAGQGAAVAAARAAATPGGRPSAGDGRVGLVGTEAPPPGVVEIARYHDAAELARLLYGALRAAEEAAVDVVVVEGVADEGIGRAVMDRLRRAAG